MRWPPGVIVFSGPGSTLVQVMRIGGAIHVIVRIDSLARSAVSPVRCPGFVDPKAQCSLVYLKRNVLIIAQSPFPLVPVPLGIFIELLFFGGMIGSAANVFREPVAISAVIKCVNPVHVITRLVDIIFSDESRRLGNFFVRVQVIFHNAAQVMVAILANGAHAFVIVFAIPEGESIRPPLDAELHQFKRNLKTFVGIHRIACN